ncbi:MAG: hypothetical protein LBG19_01150 [Prevotellaceae bacterium]|jgi:hypothetical protein|nr:hypothetical protein [Prevotellaceae bacterium]
MGHQKQSYKGNPLPIRYCMRPGESEATLLFIEGGVGMEAQFRKVAAEYFGDYPELVKKIEDKEYKREDIVEIIEDYNE